MTLIKRLMFVTIAAVISAGFVAGCGSSSSGDGDSDRAQSLTISVRNDPATLDPALIDDVDAAGVNAQVFSGLTKTVGTADGDLEVEPDLAEGLATVSDDGTTLTYTLREGLTWSDGTPLTAQDVVYGWLRSLNPETASTFAYQFTNVEGADDYNACEADCDALREAVGVTATDDRTIEIKLTSPVPWFDQLAAISVFFPQPEAAIEKHGDAWTEPENIVSSGAFKVVSHTDKQEWKLERSDEYWNADDVALEDVTIEVIENQSSAYKKFVNEELDAGFMNSFPGPGDIEEAKTDTRFKVIPTLSSQYIYLNTQSPELKDPKVRQALAIATNRVTIVEKITKTGESPIATVVPPGIPGFKTIEQGTQDFIQPDQEPDVDRAKQLLSDAGVAEGDLTISMYFSTEGSERSQLIAESIQSDFAAIGVTVNLVPQSDINSLYDLAEPPIDDKVNMISLGWIADFADASNFYTPMACDSPLNAAQYCNEAWDEIVVEGAETIDDTARFEKQKEAEAIVSGPDGDFPVISLYSDSGLTMVQPWVDGYYLSPLGLVDLSKVSMIDEG